MPSLRWCPGRLRRPLSVRIVRRCFSCGRRRSLLLRPADVASIPDESDQCFQYRSVSEGSRSSRSNHTDEIPCAFIPGIRQFLARFEAQDTQAQPVPLGRDETREAIGKVECLSSYLTHAMRPGNKEFRSLRLRNGSDRILFTSDRNPLFLSYRIFTQMENLFPLKATGHPFPARSDRVPSLRCLWSAAPGRPHRTGHSPFLLPSGGRSVVRLVTTRGSGHRLNH